MTRTTCLLLVFCAAAAAQPEWVLVSHGRPRATIVLSANPTRAAQFAARELQYHVQRIAGVALPIAKTAQLPDGPCIVVGDHPTLAAAGIDMNAMRFEEYVIAFRERSVILAGRDAQVFDEVVYDMDDLANAKGWPGFWEERGTLHAVYDFLERFCGVRWFNQTEFGTVAAKRATLAVAPRPDIRRRPAFRFRDALGAIGDNTQRYDECVGLWPRNAPAFGRWIDAAYPKLRVQYPKDRQFNRARGNMARLFALRMRNGGEIARCNHSLYGYYARFWAKTPGQEKLFVEHRPEYFAKGYKGKPPQMCYTSRGLVKQLAQDARDYYDGRSTGADQGIFWDPRLPNLFPVEPMDNRSYCKCPRCRKWLRTGRDAPGFYSSGAHSNYFFQFVNAVAEELNRTHPDAKIVTLAYSSHAAMPDFKLSPNVAVQFCFAANRSPYSRDYRHELKLLDAWAGEGVGRPLYLWLYYTFPKEHAVNGKYHCFPGFFAHTIGEQFRLFHRYGILGMFHCGYGQEVEAYVTFKLMDDPTLDVDTLLDEYFTGLYGKAGEPLKEMYLDIEKTYSDPELRPRKRTSGPAENWGCLGTAERMARYAKWMQQAHALAQTPAEKANVALFDVGVWQYMVAGRKQFIDRQRAVIPSVTAPRVANAAGDPAKVDWARAAALGDKWYERGGGRPSKRKFGGRIAHDGRYLYLELSDACDTSKLQASAMVFPFDDWEIFIAKQRAVPYRQYAWGPTGLVKALSHGEVNFRRNVPMENPGLRVASDTSAPGKWVSRVALPLDRALPGGLKPGDTFYMNILRVSSPAVSGEPRLGLDTWVSFCTVHEVDRLGAIELAR